MTSNKFLTVLVLFLVMAGCSRLDRANLTPEQLEEEIYYRTVYDKDVVNCVDRANIAARYLSQRGYKVEIRHRKDRNHVYVYYQKNGISGTILDLKDDETEKS